MPLPLISLVLILDAALMAAEDERMSPEIIAAVANALDVVTAEQMRCEGAEMANV